MGFFHRMRKVRFLQPLFLIRDSFLRKVGFFKLKSRLKERIRFAKWRVEDNRRRKDIDKIIRGLAPNYLKLNASASKEINLTSYGKRVKSFAPYAIYSILQQDLLPDRIVLNLDKTKWNDDNIPILLKKLQESGVTIQYVEDIGPHTKLIPSLLSFPDDVIITADDDVYYDPTMISELYSAYCLSDRRSVICRTGKCLLKENGRFKVYSMQPDLDDNNRSEYKLPFGVGGVLYPPHIFSEEVFNIGNLRSLCPTADDIWFGIMEIRDHIRVEYIENNSWTGNSDIDRNEEYNASVSGALYFKNDNEGRNDIQWKAMMSHYFGEGED